MKLFVLLAVVCLAAITSASPLPESSPNVKTDAIFTGIRAATPEEVYQAFGHRTFDGFLASAVSKRVNSPSSIFRRATTSVCQPYGPRFEDAQTAIYRLASLPPKTRCGNIKTPPGCTIMYSYNKALLGICGPTTTSLLCSKIALYLFGIANTCKHHENASGLSPVITAGYQGLNENILNYVFVNK